MTTNVQHFKKLLDDEQKLLQGELKTVGTADSAHPGNWNATPDKLNIDPADDDEVADKLESFEENQVILGRLETRSHEITDALARIEAGTYGVCVVCGKEIEKERLEANPAASTCMACMNK